MQGSFGAGAPFPGHVKPYSHPGFIQDMQQEDFIALGEDDETYDPEFNPSIPRQPTATATPLVEKKAPPIDSQKKAAELRAKLLANRPQSAASGRSNTPSKRKELPIQTKSQPQEPGNGGSHMQPITADPSSSAAESAGSGVSTADNRVRSDPP